MASDRRVALVTGSSLGIGRGCAEALAADGHNVVVNYRSHADEGEAVAENCKKLGVDAVAIGADVADRQAVDEMFARAIERFGRLDVFVSNAAHSNRRPFVNMEMDDFAATFNVTVWGVIHATQAAVRQMVEQRTGGSLIYISSVHVMQNYANSSAYNMGKSAGHALFMTLASELTGHRIRANVIEPGWIDTPGERKWLTEQQIAEMAADLPWGRMGSIQDIGNMAAYLASDKADYITGSLFRVDGGFVLPAVEAHEDK